MRIAASRSFLLLVALVLLIPAASFAQVAIGVGIHIGPPALPVYAQPPWPAAGYIWTPGYWGYGHLGYYWVPGVWVAPPRVGLLWTPGYWGFAGGLYGWHAGYWGPHVGFYGGINYGFGYGGVGFVGGTWAGSVFRYNTAVMNVNTAVVHDTFVDRNVVNNIAVVNHTSFNGEGGIDAHATPGEQAAANEQHVQPTAGQMSHEQAGANDRNQLASMKHGTPGTAAMDSVNGRRFNQQGRIAQGIGSGQLTPAETRNLENRESRLNGEIHNERAANGGTLTPGNASRLTSNRTISAARFTTTSTTPPPTTTATTKWATGALTSSSVSPTASATASSLHTRRPILRAAKKASTTRWPLTGRPTAAS